MGVGKEETAEGEGEIEGEVGGRIEGGGVEGLEKGQVEEGGLGGTGGRGMEVRRWSSGRTSPGGRVLNLNTK